jgi:hypothetical protein
MAQRRGSKRGQSAHGKKLDEGAIALRALMGLKQKSGQRGLESSDDFLDAFPKVNTYPTCFSTVQALIWLFITVSS